MTLCMAPGISLGYPWELVGYGRWASAPQRLSAVAGQLGDLAERRAHLRSASLEGSRRCPALAITGTLLAINLVGDWIRERVVV